MPKFWQCNVSSSLFLVIVQIKNKMRKFKTKVEGHNQEFDFECYENTEPIEIGDKYIFFFGGIADVHVCDSENVKVEINKNDRIKDESKIDLTTGFWQKCYKIKSTNFDLNAVS